MDLTDLMNAYGDKFGSMPPIFGYGLSGDQLTALLEASLRSGEPVTDAQLAEVTGRSAPDGALV